MYGRAIVVPLAPLLVVRILCLTSTDLFAGNERRSGDGDVLQLFR